MSRALFIRIFGVLQALVLVCIAVAVYLHRKREKDREESHINLDLVNLQLKVQRAQVYKPAPTEPEDSGKKTEPPALESAFPEWTKDTPSSVILGIPATADESMVESAYRTLLRRYHPDRFAHWGRGYQTRAHHIILLIQSAREEMLGLKKRP